MLANTKAATHLLSKSRTKNLTRCYKKGKDPLHEFYADNLMFIHTRTSGFNEKKDLFLEVACAITTKEIGLIAEVNISHFACDLNR